MPDADFAKLRAKRGTAAPLTATEIAAGEDRRRKREELARADRELSAVKRRRTDMGPELERVGSIVRERGEDVEMGVRGVAGARQKADADKRKAAITFWKQSSPLDEAARSVPTALQGEPGLSGIARERSSLWSKAVLKGVDSSLNSSNKDFSKWLKNQGTVNVLNKTKAAYTKVIGTVQPRTDRGRKLKDNAARRIVDIEDQIKKIEEKRVQPSRLSRTSRSRSPARKSRSRSRSKSPQVALTGAAASGKEREGEGLTKRRRRSKIVKVNKEPPSISRYFI